MEIVFFVDGHGRVMQTIGNILTDKAGKPTEIKCPVNLMDEVEKSPEVAVILFSPDAVVYPVLYQKGELKKIPPILDSRYPGWTLPE